MNEGHSLGGSGDLNLPYEDVPDGPLTYIASEAGVEISGGLVVLSAVIDHPVTHAPHPALIYRFMRPDGVAYPDRLLVLEVKELAALERLTRDSIAGAKKGARSQGGGPWD